jgi:hypothetical protein
MIAWFRSDVSVAVGLLAVLPVVSPPEVAAQVVHGRVLEFATDKAVGTALVELVAEAGAEQGEALARVVTDEEGRFTLSGPWTGTYRLRAGRIGFETVTTPPFDLVAGEEPLAVEILVAVEAVPLAPLVVVSERPVRLNLRLHTGGYYERKRTWGGWGHFLDGEELDAIIGFVVTDALRDIPGVRLEGGGGFGRTVTLRGTHGGRCIPLVWVDGAPVSSGSGIDAIVPFGDLAAIEVYPGLTKPGELETLRGGACGVIAVWTGPR